ncbi:MAG: pyridoxal-dependent decarboxylase, exosortase A system-associated [Gammaproteobacteria bacterium]
MTKKTLRHSALDDVIIDGDCMSFAGQKLTEIADNVGSTPFYAYDRQALTDRVAELRKTLPPEMHLHYAIKANPHPDLVAHMVSLVDGLDVASGGELNVALGCGADAANVSFAGPGKTANELERALNAGIVVNLESANEMRTLAQMAKARDLRPKVAIRVNPDFELKTSGMRMSGGPKQFGIDAEQVPGVLKELAGLSLDFIGFHIFAGSQNLDVGAIIEAQTKTLELAGRLSRDAPAAVRSLNIGGGLGIPYFPGDQALDLAPLGSHLQTLVGQARTSLPEATLVLELGRYLVGEAGIYVCRIVDRKISRGQVFLITDGGLHHHLSASGNFGQVIRKNFPVLIGNKIRGENREIATVVGPLCTPLDLLADRMEFVVADVGDLVVVLQSGAYGYTASPLGFLGHPAPKEILL